MQAPSRMFWGPLTALGLTVAAIAGLLDQASKLWLLQVFGLADEGVVTFNGFSAADSARDAVAIEHGNYRIDWILLRGPIACTSAEIDTRRPGGLPPSDHYPVIATIEWE